ncbi:MAG TPA: ribose ABC transporter permease [Symbiobacteriaceae bacterium]|nr:ribose ABC transporter permease [Symbiobacteriaceae bacterium]
MRDKAWWQSRLRQMGPGLAVLILGILLAILSDRFLTVNNILNVLRQVSINTIIACGMTMVILTGGIDLSVGPVLALSAAVMAGLAAGGASPVLAILVGLAIGAGLGFTNGLIVTRGGVAPFVATLATMTITRGLTLVYTEGRPVTGLPDSLRAMGTAYVGPIPLPIIFMAVIVLITYLILAHTPFGRSIYAVGSNEEAARFAGLPVRWVKTLAYTLTGLAAAMAGVILTGRLNSAQPTAGGGFELDAIAAVVLGGTSLTGGKGSVLGTVIGALIIGILDNGLNLLDVSSFYQQVAKGVVILVAVLIDRRK